jgi:nucleotide-binding universal stress UspA family protein
MKFLVGFDGSNVSRAALELAQSYASAMKAKILIVSVMSPSLSKETAPAEREAKRAVKMESELEAIENRLSAEGVACETHLLVRGVEAGEDLVRFAEEQQIDAIVIGVRRRSNVGKLIFGSIAQYIIINAHCPVITVK